MLVLSRKSGDGICIDDNVVVSVLAVKGNRVKLAIEAPRDVIVRRAELASEPPEHETLTDKTAMVLERNG